MTTLRIKPVRGRVVRDPELRDFIPAEGREVSDSAFWRRRLRDGDVALADTTGEPSPTPPAPAIDPANETADTSADPLTTGATKAASTTQRGNK